MGPKKGSSGRKRKQPAKRKAPTYCPLVISSSDYEEWPDFRLMWEKLGMLEREKAQARAREGSSAVRRSCRGSKAQILDELKRMGGIMLSHIAILEAECSSLSGSSSLQYAKHMSLWFQFSSQTYHSYQLQACRPKRKMQRKDTASAISHRDKWVRFRYHRGFL